VLKGGDSRRQIQQVFAAKWKAAADLRCGRQDFLDLDEYLGRATE